MSAPGESFLAAQQELLDVLRADGGEPVVARACRRLEAAYRAFEQQPAVDAATLERLRAMAGLLEEALAERRDEVGRELSRTQLALDLVRRRSRGARPGRQLDISG